MFSLCLILFSKSTKTVSNVTNLVDVTRKEMPMSEKQREILETFEKVVPKLNELECEKLLAFGEGISFMKDRQKQEEEK